MGDMGALNARINTSGRTTPMNESSVYRSANGPSWLRDLMRTSLNRDTTGESRQRLQQHAEDIANTAYGKGVSQNVATEYRDISRVDGSGGYA